jgi:hypothetical protein
MPLARSGDWLTHAAIVHPEGSTFTALIQAFSNPVYPPSRQQWFRRRFPGQLTKLLIEQ